MSCLNNTTQHSGETAPTRGAPYRVCATTSRLLSMMVVLSSAPLAPNAHAQRRGQEHHPPLTWLPSLKHHCSPVRCSMWLSGMRHSVTFFECKFEPIPPQLDARNSTCSKDDPRMKVFGNQNSPRRSLLLARNDPYVREQLRECFRARNAGLELDDNGSPCGISRGNIVTVQGGSMLRLPRATNHFLFSETFPAASPLPPCEGPRQSGGISPSTPPYSWYTRRALSRETPP
jgi:hypothetical protein